MRVSDQNLLPQAASPTAQNATSRRSKDHDRNESGFNNVYSETAAARRRSEDKANASADNSERSSASKRDADAAQDNSKPGAVNDNASDEAKEHVDQQPAKHEAADKNGAIIKLLANAENLDETKLAELAQELDMSAEELAEALKALAEAGDSLTPDQMVSQEPSSTEEDTLSLLFKLLIGQKKAEGEQDTSDANAGKAGDDAGSENSLDSQSIDDITGLLNALMDGAKSQASSKEERSQDALNFRFERADGKGTPLDLQLSDAMDGLTLEATEGKPAKTENITVLDVRRYLAPTDVNASNVLNTITGDKSWASAMKNVSSAQAAAMMPEKTITEVNTLKIQMQPVNLGTVTATMRLKGDELVVSMNVTTAEAYNQMTLDKDKILNSLRSQGFSVDQINVQYTPNERGVQQSASSQQHQDGQQMAGGDGGTARQDQQDGNRRQGADGTGAAFGAEEVAAAGGDRASGEPVSGQLYL